MKEIDISGYELDDEKGAILSTYLHNIEVLNISNCKLTATEIKHIVNAIERRQTPVQ